MKKIIILFFLFAVVAGFSFAADPAEGYWLSIDDNTGRVTAAWHIYQQGNQLYGMMLSMADYPRDMLAVRCKESYRGFPVSGNVSRMPVIGTPWIFGLTSRRAGEWTGGNIINPEDGNMYTCRITFRPADGRRYLVDTLEMRGELFLGIGRSQFWTKTDQRTAESLGPR